MSNSFYFNYSFISIILKLSPKDSAVPVYFDASYLLVVLAVFLKLVCVLAKEVASWVAYKGHKLASLVALRFIFWNGFSFLIEGS